MNIIPLYRFESSILVGLDIDFVEPTVEDGLVVEIDLKEKEIKHQPWSGQKKLKFGYYYTVEVSGREIVLEEILNALDKNKIIQIIDILLYPNKESIDSLIWLPERLRIKNTQS